MIHMEVIALSEEFKEKKKVKRMAVLTKSIKGICVVDEKKFLNRKKDVQKTKMLLNEAKRTRKLFFKDERH